MGKAGPLCAETSQGQARGHGDENWLGPDLGFQRTPGPDRRRCGRVDGRPRAGPRGGTLGRGGAGARPWARGRGLGGARATEPRVRAGRSGPAVGVTQRGLEVTTEPASQDEPLGHETGTSVPGEPPRRPRPAGVPAPRRVPREEASSSWHGAHAAPGFRAPGGSGVLLSTATRRGRRGGRDGDVLSSDVSGKPRARSAQAPTPAPAPARLPHHAARPAALHPASPETHSGLSPSRQRTSRAHLQRFALGDR